MSIFRFASVCPGALALSCCFTVHASTEQPFDLLKSLQGVWKIEAEGKPLATEMTYDLGSKQSVVTERFGKELSVFYKNGETVEMVHFCNAGNQPRLRLKQVNIPDVLDFEVFGTTNLSTPEAPHVREIIYKFVHVNTIELAIIWSSKPEDAERYTLHRVVSQR